MEMYEPLRPFTDIHSHVIWGVDDGAEEKEETFRMLREAVEDGIHTIICTPHMTPGVYEFPMEKFREHFFEAGEYIRRQELPLALYSGAEILWTEHVPRLLREGKIPTLAGSQYVLVEFSPTDSYEKISDALQKVSGTGYLPVIAHMERYPAIGKTEQVRELRDRAGARVQINARTLTRKQPLLRRRFFDSLFTERLADFIATDTHALPGRRTCMTEGMNVLRQKYGDRIAQRIEQAPGILFTKR